MKHFKKTARLKKPRRAGWLLGAISLFSIQLVAIIGPLLIATSSTAAATTLKSGGSVTLPGGRKCTATFDTGAQVDFSGVIEALLVPGGGHVSDLFHNVGTNISKIDQNAAKTLFTQAADKANVKEAITFSGDQTCNEFVFVQKAPGSSEFYGITSCYNFASDAASTDLLLGTITKDGVFSFPSPGRCQGGKDSTISFTIAGFNSSFLGSGNGGAFGSDCSAYKGKFSTPDPSSDPGTRNQNLGHCLTQISLVAQAPLFGFLPGQTATPAKFVDFATICFGGETFHLINWSGDGNKYPTAPGFKSLNNNNKQLVKYELGNFDKRCGTETDPDWLASAKGGTPYLEVGGITINDNASLGGLQALKTAFDNVGTTPIISVYFHNFTSNGASKPTLTTDSNTDIFPDVNTSGFKTVGSYYGSSDSIYLAVPVGSGGQNESKYTGTYSLDKQRTNNKSGTGYYVYDNSSAGGCSGSTQQPDFDSFSYLGYGANLTEASVGNLIDAHWVLAPIDKGAGCSPGVPIVVQLSIADANASPPLVKQSDDAAGKDTPTCESSGFSLSWIMCPIINGLASAVDGIYDSVIKPLLVTSPIITSADGDPTNIYKIWSNFRIYGDVFLVIALLVIVFGQSIGGGLIDAYSAKKILPRLLIAAVLINLSIYIVALAVDVTNIIGGGIQTLLTQPFRNSGTFTLTLSGGTSATIGAGLGLTALLGVVGTGVSIWALIAHTAVAIQILAPLVQFLLLFIVLPAFLIMVSIVATVLIRRGLIIFLVVISPVAFALYCLPNTEQYFRKWWDLLFKTLLVYPIIAAVFAIANILSVTINMGGKTSGFADWVSSLMSIAALIIPLFLIPFSFRIAGGIIGKAHETLTNYHKRGQEALKGNVNDPNSLRNRVKRNAGASLTRTKAQSYRGLKGLNGGSGRLPGLNAALFGRSIEKEAALNQEAKQRIANIKDNGDDSVVNARASFIDPFGQRRTLDGKAVSAADWAASKRLFPNLSDIQSVADYRSTKVNSTEEAKQFTDNFARMAQQNGLSLDETKGSFTALAFARQNERGEWKHGSWAKGADGGYVFKPVGAGNLEGAANMQKEQYYKKDGFTASRAFSSQFEALGAIKQAHLDVLNDDSATPEAKAASREQLRQNLELADAWEHSSGQNPETGEMEYGLSGASAGTTAAFNNMKSVGMQDAKEKAIIEGLQAEIKNGKTWEALNGGGNAPLPPVRNSNVGGRGGRGGDSGGGGGGPRIIRPGDDGFNLPPSQQPRP